MERIGIIGFVYQKSDLFSQREKTRSHIAAARERPRCPSDLRPQITARWGESRCGFSSGPSASCTFAGGVFPGSWGLRRGEFDVASPPSMSKGGGGGPHEDAAADSPPGAAEGELRPAAKGGGGGEGSRTPSSPGRRIKGQLRCPPAPVCRRRRAVGEGWCRSVRRRLQFLVN